MSQENKNICGVEYLCIDRAAAFVGVHKETLKQETRKKKITSLKIGKSLYYLPQWLETYIENKIQYAKKG